jgi:hypothetical protein
MPSRSPVVLLYSGEKSHAFWERIKKLPEPSSSVVYALACVLQGIEYRVVTQLHNAEAMEKEIGLMEERG